MNVRHCGGDEASSLVAPRGWQGRPGTTPTEDSMERRGLLKLACAIMPITALDPRAEAHAEELSVQAAIQRVQTRVAYHLSDLDKVDFVLGNIRNHYNGMGGPDKVNIVLVVHGPALKAFHTATAAPEVVERMAELQKSGLAPQACINTMRAQEVTIKDLVPGFAIADKGGVVRLAELQAQGYVYLRP
jgi:uncharacterized protein